MNGQTFSPNHRKRGKGTTTTTSFKAVHDGVRVFKQGGRSDHRENGAARNQTHPPKSK